MNGLESLTTPLVAGLAGLALVAVVAIGAMGLTSTYVPQPIDEAMKLEDTITKTADYNGASYDLGALFSPGGVGQPLAGVVEVTALDTANENEVYYLTLEESADNATFAPCGPKVPITGLGGWSVPGFVSKRYTRLALDVDGTTPSITYKSWLSPNIA